MLKEFDPGKHRSKACVLLCEAEGLPLGQMLRAEDDCSEWGPSPDMTSAFVRLLGRPVFSMGPTKP